MKICRSCRESKALSEFYSDRRYRGGFTTHCKECRKAYSRARHLRLRDQISAAWRERYYRDVEVSRAISRIAMMKWSRSRGVRPKTEFASEAARLAARVEYKRRYVSRHPERVMASKMRYYAANPDVWRDAKARRRGAVGRVTAAQWRGILAFYDNACAHCNSAALPLTRDHYIPIIAGGTNTFDNVWPLCLPCNLKKGKAVPTIPGPPHAVDMQRTG